MTTPQPLIPQMHFASRGLLAPQAKVFAEIKSPDPVKDEDILQEAHDHFRHVCDYESEERRRWDEELKFCDEYKHWTEEQKTERHGLPCLTFDMVGPRVDLVVNSMRQNPPEPRVSAVGNGADKETAKLIQGLLRNIDNDSGAEIAWMTAYEHAVKIGRGWVRLYYDYEADGSFDMKLVISRVLNPFSVYADPAAEKYDYSDMRRCLVSEKMDKREFEKEYPGASPAPINMFEGPDGERFRQDWYPLNQVRIGEYWWVEIEEKTIYQLDDKRIVTLQDMPEGARVINKRKQKMHHVKMAKVTGSEVLSTLEWPGKGIPIIPVLGREYLCEGKRQLRGMVRAMMDANLSYDYMRSRQAQAIGLAPIAPFMVVEGQIEGHKMQWDQANRKPWPYLTYKNEVNGRPVGAPERTHAEVEIAGITQAVAQAAEDIKQTSSTFNADLGAEGPESSGKAIIAKQLVGDKAHFHYADNLARSIRRMAELEIDLIPHVYSEPRVLAINDPDGSTKTIAVNQLTEHEGVQRIFDLANDSARYHVTTGTGPSYASRREQGKAALMEILPQIPVIAARAPDLLIKALDVPDGDAIADRIRPPEVKADQEGAPPIPRGIQQQLAQQNQMIQALVQKLDEKTHEILMKGLEVGAQKEIAAMRGQVDILKADAASKSAELQLLAKLDHEAVKHRLDLEAAEGQQQQEQGNPQGGRASTPGGQAQSPDSSAPGTPNPPAPGPAPAMPAPAA